MDNNSEFNNISNFLKTKYGIIGNSKPMRDVISLLVQAAPTNLTVLITGETGTGKDVFANALHGLSKRSKYPYVSINCGAIPETLLESELFGHEKGAFTGASDQRKGFFESANKGTIFLDEVGEMPIGTQVKLLRILESNDFSRLGSSAVHKVDVRVIAATNRDLEKEVSERNFRKDLYFRLKSVNLKLPSLRDHIEDMPLLVDYFAEAIAQKLSIKYSGITDDALNILMSMHWLGNVRELRNLIETLMTLDEPELITPVLIRKYIAPALPPYSSDSTPDNNSIVQVQNINPNNINELGLIFQTLLQIQNDITNIKSILKQQHETLEDIKMNAYPPEIHSVSEESIYNEIENFNLSEIEKKLIIHSLKKYDGNRRQAAEALGISERTLYRKITEYEII